MANTIPQERFHVGIDSEGVGTTSKAPNGFEKGKKGEGDGIPTNLPHGPNDIQDNLHRHGDSQAGDPV